MICEKINLRKEEINGFMPTLTTYVIYDSVYRNNAIWDDPEFKDETEKQRKRPAVIICPGGGYAFCSPREAEPIAIQMNAAGINAFVLDYCVAPIRYPEALKDVSEAIKLVRANADKWGVDPDKIAVCGFSAGGHLAGSIGTLWNSDPAVKCDGKANKPNAMILSYPVLIYGEKAHKGSFENLLGEGLTDAEYDKMSLEKHIDGDTPSAFLWHTFEDDCVPVENSLVFANELKKHDVPFELHIYPKGGHGLSLATTETGDCDDLHVNSWVKLACEWLKIVFK